MPTQPVLEKGRHRGVDTPSANAWPFRVANDHRSADSQTTASKTAVTSFRRQESSGEFIIISSQFESSALPMFLV